VCLIPCLHFLMWPLRVTMFLQRLITIESATGSQPVNAQHSYIAVALHFDTKCLTEDQHKRLTDYARLHNKKIRRYWTFTPYSPVYYLHTRTTIENCCRQGVTVNEAKTAICTLFTRQDYRFHAGNHHIPRCMYYTIICR
jgi:hypothetical protein